MAPDYAFTRLQAASQEWKAIFYRELEIGDADLVYKTLCQLVTMTGRTLHVDWIGQIPGMVQWLGDRPFAAAAGQGFDLVAELYTTPRTRVPRTTVDDDALGQFAALPSAHAKAALQHREQLLAALLQTPGVLCYDGSPWLGNAHRDEIADPLQQNYFPGAGTALTIPNILPGMSAMGALAGGQGRPLGIVPNVCIYGPANMARAAAIFGTALYNDGTVAVSNPTPLAIKPVLMPFLGASTMWYLADLSKGIRPVVMGVRDEPELAIPEGAESEALFLRDQWEVACRARHGLAPGLWQLIQAWDGTP